MLKYITLQRKRDTAFKGYEEKYIPGFKRKPHLQHRLVSSLQHRLKVIYFTNNQLPELIAQTVLYTKHFLCSSDEISVILNVYRTIRVIQCMFSWETYTASCKMKAAEPGAFNRTYRFFPKIMFCINNTEVINTKPGFFFSFRNCLQRSS